MRFSLLSSLFILLLSPVAGCGDDAVMLGDTGTTTDTGAPDTSPPDTGPVDSGTDTRMDTAVVDTGPPTCAPEASGITFPSEEWNAEVVAEGVDVNEPVGVAWSASDVLLFSNSTSWIGAGMDAGNVLELDAESIGIFAEDDSMRGVGHMAWTDGFTDGLDEGLYVAVEDATAAGMSDAVLKVAADGSLVEILSAVVNDPGELEIGDGGDFGEDVYVTSRENASSGVPNQRQVHRITADGTTTVFTIMDGSSEITGAWALELGPGGALGTDLYLGTLEDPGFSPGSMNAIYRVRASDGEANLFATGVRPLAMAAPAPGGDFGEYLYVVTANAIVRFDPMGDGEMFADGIMSSAGLRFGPDGALYLAQPGGGRVIRIAACAP